MTATAETKRRRQLVYEIAAVLDDIASLHHWRRSGRPQDEAYDQRRAEVLARKTALVAELEELAA